MINLSWDSVIRIATRYGLGGPVIESQWKGRDFLHPSGPDLGPKHLFIQWVPGLSRRYSDKELVLKTQPI
jgi:hypothetical protein